VPYESGMGSAFPTNGLTVRCRHMSCSSAAKGFRPNPLRHKAFSPLLVVGASHRFSPFRALYAPSASALNQPRLPCKDFSDPNAADVRPRVETRGSCGVTCYCRNLHGKGSDAR
jgi:hypothetical protein